MRNNRVNLTAGSCGCARRGNFSGGGRLPLALGLTMTRLLLSCFLIIMMAGCDQAESTPENAKGDTPIQQVICGASDKDCIVVARFKDFQSCEWHNKMSNMLCDSMSNPGTVTCTTPTSTTAHGYCTK